MLELLSTFPQTISNMHISNIFITLLVFATVDSRPTLHKRALKCAPKGEYVAPPTGIYEATPVDRPPAEQTSEVADEGDSLELDLSTEAAEPTIVDDGGVYAAPPAEETIEIIEEEEEELETPGAATETAPPAEETDVVDEGDSLELDLTTEAAEPTIVDDGGVYAAPPAEGTTEIIEEELETPAAATETSPPAQETDDVADEGDSLELELTTQAAEPTPDAGDGLVYEAPPADDATPPAAIETEVEDLELDDLPPSTETEVEATPAINDEVDAIIDSADPACETDAPVSDAQEAAAPVENVY
jgi:hypothetical protein